MSSRWSLKHRSWPPPGPRTEMNYDVYEGRPWCNLRYVKWGPKGARWEQHHVTVAAHGPPHGELRQNMGCCWLCNAELQEHQRKWTRPKWTRTLRTRRVVDPYGRVANYRGCKTEPTSQLDMTIYCCPNGCDADDALQSLLDQTDHTGPQYAPVPRYFRRGPGPF